AAKARIAEHLKPGGLLVLNADDPGAMSVLEHVSSKVRVRTFGIQQSADLQATILDESLDGTHMRLTCGTEQVTVLLPLIGRHNVENALGAIAALQHLGVSLTEIAEELPYCEAAPGRLQRIASLSGPAVFVDYAHTPDALTRVIETLRHLTFGRMIAVCGAGGDRDQTKRPLMGAALSAADHVVLTADNPRTEDPAVIAEQMRAGINGSVLVETELDRRQAIERAIGLAESGDVVLVAGKGHEREQIVGRQRLPFHDAAVCAQALIRKASLTPLQCVQN
ncbi:MAG: hypothetical protein KDA58_15060, partial [Planctomycetaceae bacterium]|nr:hypothetical protein [Planctomycetaceae bacterium]